MSCTVYDELHCSSTVLRTLEMVQSSHRPFLVLTIILLPYLIFALPKIALQSLNATFTVQLQANCLQGFPVPPSINKCNELFSSLRRRDDYTTPRQWLGMELFLDNSSPFDLDGCFLQIMPMAYNLGEPLSLREIVDTIHIPYMHCIGNRAGQVLRRMFQSGQDREPANILVSIGPTWYPPRPGRGPPSSNDYPWQKRPVLCYPQPSKIPSPICNPVSRHDRADPEPAILYNDAQVERNHEMGNPGNTSSGGRACELKYPNLCHAQGRVFNARDIAEGGRYPARLWMGRRYCGGRVRRRSAIEVWTGELFAVD